MSAEQNFGQMFEESQEAAPTIRNGAVVEGTVLDVKPDVAYFNIGYKSDGVLVKQEYSNENVDLTEKLHVGDKLEVKVMKVDDREGFVNLTYKRLAQEKGNKRIEEAYNNGEVLKAKVTQVQSGGLTVLVEDTRVFIPASLVSDVFEKDLTKYDGQEIEFRITEFNPRRKRIIGDRRHLIAERKAEAAKELFSRIQSGDVIEGTVKNVTDFGAFVDLGGADGLLHISEMSWGRVENPHKNFHVGDQLTVMIKDIKDEKIALSLKFPDENPWIEASERFAAGSVVTGTVARMTDFGAFIELLPGVDALLHVSQISRNHVDKPSDVLSIGQVIEAKVVDFNAEDRKISLSIKQLETEAAEEAPAEEAPVEE